MDGDSDRIDTSVRSGDRGSAVENEKGRRASIQAIMKDPDLTPQERRKSIQNLMDGRRRSSSAADGGGMAAAAAAAALEFADSSDDDIEEEGGNMNGDSNNLMGAGSPEKKRSSLLFKTGSSLNSNSRENGKSGKRRYSIRDTLAAGFSKMGVKGSSSVVEDIPVAAEPNALSRKMEKSRPPCDHYERNCSVVSPCCGLVFGCRICHDDAPELPPPFLLTGVQPDHGMAAAPAGGLASSAGATLAKPRMTHRSASLPADFGEDETHHEIDRFLIKEVVCRECFTRQSSKT